MARVTQTLTQDVLDMYSGYNQQKVGAGLLNPDIYASPEYSKKKIKTLMICSISRISYGGMETDPQPTIITLRHESQYNTVLALNLRYIPTKMKQPLLKYILDANQARIRANQPMMIDWHALNRAFPFVGGITRRYKTFLIGLKETVPLVEWPEVVKESSPFSNVYKQNS